MCVLICISVFKIFFVHIFVFISFFPLKIVGHNFDVNYYFIGFFLFIVFVYNKLYNFCMFINI